MILFEEIRNLLPQKYPFLFIDRVVEFEEGKKIVCVKNVSGNEPVFVGHFPDFAIMPGVLIIEAMAQASIILPRIIMIWLQMDSKPFSSALIFINSILCIK